MDFITAALYTMDTDEHEQLAGALITRFNPDSVTSRATVEYVTAERLASGEGLSPSGFAMSPEGVLLSDTLARREMGSQLTQYVSSELTGPAGITTPSLVDIILYGANYGALVVQNYSQLLKEPGETEPILIPMHSFRVSESTFNIYAPYKNAEGFFRTMSLVDIATDEHYPFVMAVPKDELLSRPEYLGVLMQAELSDQLEELPPMDQIEGYRLYRSNLPLRPFPTFTGEAFCNYLAYNVAYYKLGLQIIKEFLEDTKFVEDNDIEEEEPKVARESKTPLHTVTIQCSYRRTYIREILEPANGNGSLSDITNGNPEAHITLMWLQKLFKSAEEFKCADYGESLAAAAASMRYDCKMQLLHYASELLEQRYYICKAGPFEDTLGAVLKGGGVNGSSLKRVIG